MCKVSARELASSVRRESRKAAKSYSSLRPGNVVSMFGSLESRVQLMNNTSVREDSVCVACVTGNTVAGWGDGIEAGSEMDNLSEHTSALMCLVADSSRINERSGFSVGPLPSDKSPGTSSALPKWNVRC